MAQLHEELVAVRLDVLWEGEQRITFRERNRADVACPRIDILKDMTMERPEVGKVETAFNGTLAKLKGAHKRQLAFALRQGGSIGDTELVAENRRPRVDVGILH